MTASGRMWTVGLAILLAILLAVLVSDLATDKNVGRGVTYERAPPPAYQPPPTSPISPAESTGKFCTKGCRCGNSCIDCSKTCRK